MIEEASGKMGTYAVWSVGGPSAPEQRANTIDGFPKRSSLMRDTGVLDVSIAAGEATVEALSSIEICIRSFGSRTLNTKVSTMFLESTLNEYWALVKGAESGNSRRTRTQSALDVVPAGIGWIPGIGVLESSVECPRATSKSLANISLAGTFASAEDNSFCSSVDGVHTFRTFTFTGGCWAKLNVERINVVIRICRGNTAKLYQEAQAVRASCSRENKNCHLAENDGPVFF